MIIKYAHFVFNENPFLAIDQDSLPIPTIDTIFNGNSSSTCVKLKKKSKLNPSE